MAGSPPNWDNVRWPASGGLRVPQEMGSAVLALVTEIDVNVGGAGTTNTVTLKDSQCMPSYLTVTNAGSGTTTIVWPGVFAGLSFTVYNNSGQSCVFQVTGKTGITVANGKKAILVMDSVAGDIQRVTADT